MSPMKLLTVVVAAKDLERSYIENIVMYPTNSPLLKEVLTEESNQQQRVSVENMIMPPTPMYVFTYSLFYYQSFWTDCNSLMNINTHLKQIHCKYKRIPSIISLIFSNLAFNSNSFTVPLHIDSSFFDTDFICINN